MEKTRLYRCLGMMSGTSMDGIDLSLIQTDGESDVRPMQGGSLFVPYSDDVRSLVKAVLMRTDRSDADVVAAENAVTKAHCDALDAFVDNTDYTMDDVDIISAHGQTITHIPQNKLSIQLGNAQEISNHVGRPVVFDLRQNDVMSGGQGAPLLPIYHNALMKSQTKKGSVAILNLGGVGNITYMKGDDDLSSISAFDTGPANAYIDDWIQRKTGKRMDVDGAFARAGQIDQSIVEKFLQDPYFAEIAPKSLDRNHFSYLLQDAQNLSVEDGAATLLECSLQAVKKAVEHCPDTPQTLYVCGGGAQNEYLMQRLGEILPCDVQSLASLGLESDYIEAQGFAYIAVRSIFGLPITFPKTTGAPFPLTGGRLYTPMSVEEMNAGTLPHTQIAQFNDDPHSIEEGLVPETNTKTNTEINADINEGASKDITAAKNAVSNG